MSSTVPTLMEGVWSRRGHVGLRSGVVACTTARAALQPCPHVGVKPAARGAVEEDAGCAQGTWKVIYILMYLHGWDTSSERSTSASEFYEVELSST